MSKSVQVNAVSDNRWLSYLKPNEDSIVYKKRFKVSLLVGAVVLFSTMAGFGGMSLFVAHGSLPLWMAHAVGTIGPKFSMGLFVAGLAGLTVSIPALVVTALRKEKVFSNSQVENIKEEENKDIESTTQPDYSPVENNEIDDESEFKCVDEARFKSALGDAILDKNAGAVRKLLNNNKDMDVNVTIEMGGFTPLHVACEKATAEVVQILLAHGAQVDKANIDGLTPLHMACKKARIDKEVTKIIGALIDAGADVNRATATRLFPLGIACTQNNLEIIKLLLSRGAHVNQTNVDSNSPLQILILEGQGHIDDAVEFLLQSGVDIQHANRENETALAMCKSHVRRKDSVKTIQLLENA